MLQIHYGLNEPFNSAYTPVREANVAGTSFVTGTWVKLTNGKAVQAAKPTNVATTLGLECVFEPADKNWQGVVPTIAGFFEASTDQYEGTPGGVAYGDGVLLTVSANGKLDTVAAANAEDALAIAIQVGAIANGVIRFRKLR